MLVLRASFSFSFFFGGGGGGRRKKNGKKKKNQTTRSSKCVQIDCLALGLFSWPLCLHSSGPTVKLLKPRQFLSVSWFVCRLTILKEGVP